MILRGRKSRRGRCEGTAKEEETERPRRGNFLLSADIPRNGLEGSPGSSWLSHSSLGLDVNVGMADTAEEGTVRRTKGMDLGQVYARSDSFPCHMGHYPGYQTLSEKENERKKKIIFFFERVQYPG